MVITYQEAHVFILFIFLHFKEFPSHSTFKGFKFSAQCSEVSYIQTPLKGKRNRTHLQTFKLPAAKTTH